MLTISENGLKILQKRYLKKNEEGNVVETHEELFSRVANSIAKADLLYSKTESDVQHTAQKFYELITSLRFLPNSPTLMNAGRRLGQLSACFVLPVGDSMESIFDAVKYAAIIHKTGGGTGFSFSNLRPKGDVVGSTKGISSGPVSFMTVFDTATEAVKQGGTRRGANMGILRVDHPDILEFITCKDNNSKLNNFNISVGLTEEFMTAVEEDRDYPLINPRTKIVVNRLKARDVFERIVNQAWKNGEPGIVFLDRINASNPLPSLGKIESTNPCGEQPLLPYESCNLGSINLAKMITKRQEVLDVDWGKLKETIWDAVHFLDNVIDVNKYPLKIIEEKTKANRKIGLGVMGWADMLIQLRIPYNSQSAIELAEKVMSFIQTEGRLASCELAKQRGVFPNYNKSIFSGDIPMRNATITTIAPTGTLSIIAGCSSGIEPLFAVSFVRNVLEGTKLIEVNPYFEEEMKALGLFDKGLIERISQNGSLRDIHEIPEEIRHVFVTAHDITPFDHVKMQSVFQKYTDNAVSKTVNFPNSATVKDVEDVFLLSYKLGCKGVTVYRDGSREEQVISKQSTPQDNQFKKKEKEKVDKTKPEKRPEILTGKTQVVKTGCGNLYVTVNEYKSKPFEIFTNMGKAGGCASSQAEAIGRLISLALRSNIDTEVIVKHLRGITCHSISWGSNGRVNSCADAIAQVLSQYVQNENRKLDIESKHISGACPECGSSVVMEEGCEKCHSCGYTKCG